MSTCDVDKVEHVVGAIYQAFDTDNDGKVGQFKDYLLFLFIPISHLDFKEFVVGFLLTTKGSIEEKLDYTFQIYGKNILHSHSNRFRCYSFQILIKMVTLINQKSTSWLK